MPNLSQVIKAEISRISRREIKAATNPIRSSTVSLKKTAADLKRKVAALESDVKRLLTFFNAQQAQQQSQAVQTNDNKTRVTAKGVRTLRSKLGLSQEAFAKLLGVSSQAVYIMEHKEGRLNLRSATLSHLLAIRGIGKREAKAKLAEKKPEVKKQAKRKRRKSK
jgi:DNA-binding transcriptional regulator YiaG